MCPVQFKAYGDLGNTAYDLNQVMEKSLSQWDQGDFGAATNSAGAVLAAVGNMIGNANFGYFGDSVALLGAVASLRDAYNKSLQAQTPTEQMDAALSLVAATGNLLSAGGVTPQVKMAGVALAAGANLAKLALKNGDSLSDAFSPPTNSYGGVKFGPDYLHNPHLKSPFFSPTRRDPLTLDLDANGIATTAAATNGLHFDHDANGFAESTGWLNPADAFLALDRNDNGTIDTGNELFGDQTLLRSGAKAASGLQALAEWDSNRDGQIDAADTQRAIGVRVI